MDIKKKPILEKWDIIKVQVTKDFCQTDKTAFMKIKSGKIFLLNHLKFETWLAL